MNRASSTSLVYDSLKESNGIFNGGRIVKDEENFSYYIDLEVITMDENNKPTSVYIEKAITLQENDIDYKDIIVYSLFAEDCLTKEAFKIIFDCFKLVPKVISGNYLRFLNIFQYNKYLNGSRGYDNIPNKYMTLEMALNIIGNNGKTSIPNDLKEFINSMTKGEK